MTKFTVAILVGNFSLNVQDDVEVDPPSPPPPPPCSPVARGNGGDALGELRPAAADVVLVTIE